MLARAVKPNCDGLHDMAKRLMIWAFTGKRKLSTKKSTKLSQFYENGNSFNPKRRRFSEDQFRNQQGFKNNLENINWDSVNLKPFTKNFYTPHPNVLKRSSEEVKKFLNENEITIKGKNCPAPIFTFEEAGLSEKMIDVVRRLNYLEPTPIQSQGWPIALSGRNMVGIARTGSGKTLGFILPAVIHIKNQPKLEWDEGPVVLVVAPTRELVQQIKAVSDSLAKAMNIRTVAVYGGSDRRSQGSQLRNSPEICIATPGRLLDFLSSGATNLKRCTYLVLDEADRMFDMGFEPQIRSIIEQIRPDRQVLMWSATWPKEIRNLAEEYLDDYIQLNVGSLELMANPNIKQIIHVCTEREKNDLLMKLLTEIMENQENKTLVFVSTKAQADSISRFLNSCGCQGDCLHGGKSQYQRERTLHAFRRGRTSVLVATDVAARGLDVSDIRYVINFDFPKNIEDYIHRIGRTGRHNATGVSHSFLTNEDSSMARELISVLRQAKQEVSPELEQLANIKYKNFNNSNFSRGFYRRPVRRKFY